MHHLKHPPYHHFAGIGAEANQHGCERPCHLGAWLLPLDAVEDCRPPQADRTDRIRRFPFFPWRSYFSLTLAFYSLQGNPRFVV